MKNLKKCIISGALSVALTLTGTFSVAYADVNVQELQNDEISNANHIEVKEAYTQWCYEEGYKDDPTPGTGSSFESIDISGAEVVSVKKTNEPYILTLGEDEIKVNDISYDIVVRNLNTESKEVSLNFNYILDSYTKTYPYASTASIRMGVSPVPVTAKREVKAARLGSKGEPDILKINLSEMAASKEVYVYGTTRGVHVFGGAKFTFNLSVQTDDPQADKVRSLKITTPPDKIIYHKGESFSRKGMVVKAVLEDGAEAVVNGYTIEPEGALDADTKEVVITYGTCSVKQPIMVEANAEILSAEVLNGQFTVTRVPTSYDPQSKDRWAENPTENHLIVKYGEETARLKLQIPADAELYLDDVIQTGNGGEYNISLPADTADKGKESTIIVKKGEESNQYKFFCHKQRLSGLPDRVVDHLCIASQYTNQLGLGPYGTNPVGTLLGDGMSITSSMSYHPPVSLGNYGGYITFYYEDAIYDDPKNPYGIDFIAYGNSNSGNSNFAEPGQVWVSEDNKKWYPLAGSWHYDEKTIWNSEVTYTKDAITGKALYEDTLGNKGVSYFYPEKRWYPLHEWTEETENSMTLSGMRLANDDGTNEYGNTLPVYPSFGYADCGLRTNSNVADNPYTSMKEPGYSGKSDGFDLAWAVNPTSGRPKTFKKGIHYIKVQTASMIDNGAIGEKSTEIDMMRVAQPEQDDVGKTASLQSVTIDEVKHSVFDENFQSISNGREAVEVNGAFEVTVETESDNDNVFINGLRGKSRTFKDAPHGIIRVIVQSGKQEPEIYYFSISQKAETDKPITAIKFNTDGGRIENESAITMYFDKDTKADFPSPTKEGYTFLGWYGGQQQYTKYEEGMPEEVSLVAKWKENNPKPVDPDKKITVSFRLIGSTLSKGEVDLSSETKDDYKGAEYVTWISTRSYTLPEESTVYDLFAQAMKDAGLKEEGGAKGYVSTIWAPQSLGGYALSEFTNGQYSGWMYTMNGEHTDGIKIQKLLNHAEIVFHYVNDYRYEVADWSKLGGDKWPQLGTGKFHNEWLKAPDRIGGTGGGNSVAEEVKNVTTDTKAGTTTSPTDVKVSEKTATDGTKEKVAEVTVSADNQKEILKQAKENKSFEIILEVSAGNTKGAESVQMQLDTAFVKDIVEKTNADLTVNTENGKVTLDQETLKTIIGEAKGNTVTIEITKVTKPTEAQKKAAGVNGHLLKLTIKSGDKVISDFNKGKVKVVAEIVSKLLDKKVAAIHIADDGKIEQLAGKVLTIGGKKYYEFTTPHFSTFALVDADELGLEVAEEPQTDVKALTAKLTPVARSAKTAKKNVKVTTSLDKQDKAIIKELKDAGYTVKYRFYRSTKKAAGYKAAVTKKTAAYTNTGGKKGTKYFYKVQVRVYDENGKLTAKTALKQCKYASRTWAK